jgi:hypothetical protein
MLLFLLSAVFSMVPVRYRGRFLSDFDVNVQRGAVASGIMEMLFCLAAFIVRYLFFFQARIQGMAGATIRKGGESALADSRVQFGAGTIATLEYLIQPVTLLLIFFLFEGIVRFMAAFLTQEVIASLPLQTIAWLHGLFEWKKEREFLGPLIVDVVRPGNQTDYDLKIESCRPRDWTPMTTVFYQEQLYELHVAREGPPPRRFIYLLRKAPANKLVRGFHRYSPDELMPPEPAAPQSGTEKDGASSRI